MKDTILTLVMVLVPMILSLSVHEWAHAFAATKLGDDTAARQGRLTLSPDKHIDILGTLVFPVIGVLLAGALFGWARPVPFNPTNFTRKVSIKTGTLIVAIAGPLSNLVLALVCAVALKLVFVFGGPVFMETDIGQPLSRLLGAGFFLNIVLFVFNFAPVPPLDGSKILYGILPSRYDGVVEWLERHQFVVFILLLFFGIGLMSRFLMVPLARLIIGLLGLEPVQHLITITPSL